MRLLDLVEQHHLIGPAPNRFGQCAALLVADIAGRRADQPGHGVLLHEFRHVHTDHRRLVVEQEFGERLGELGLADARGAQEHERANRPIGVLQARPGAAHGGRHRFDGLVLADDALRQRLFHTQELVALALQHLVDGDPGPARYHLTHMVGHHRFLEHDVAAFLGVLDLRDLLLQIRNDPVGEFAGALVLARALRLGQLVAGIVELLLEVGGRSELVLLRLPAGLQMRGLLLEVGEILLQLFESVPRSLVGLFLQGLPLDLELDDAPVELVEFLGLRIHLHAEPRRGLVNEVDRLVRQETVGDVAIRQGRRCNERGVADSHPVMLLVALLQAAQDRHGVFHRRLRHEHGLEPAGERGILLDVLAILVERGRANAVQIAARERGFE